jgi:hypothetical protein
VIHHTTGTPLAQRIAAESNRLPTISEKEQKSRKTPYRERDSLYKEAREEHLDRDGMTEPAVRPLPVTFPDAGEEGCNGKKFDLATQARRRRSLGKLKHIFHDRFDIHCSEDAVEAEITAERQELRLTLTQKQWQEELMKQAESEQDIESSSDEEEWDAAPSSTGSVSLGYHGRLHRVLDGQFPMTAGHTDPRHNKIANKRMGILRLLRRIAIHSFRQQNIKDDTSVLRFNEKVRARRALRSLLTLLATL